MLAIFGMKPRRFLFVLKERKKKKQLKGMAFRSGNP